MNTNQRASCQNDYFFQSSFFLLRLKKLSPNINGMLAFMELDGARYFYYIDATYMVRGLFNSDGELIVRYSYDAWGNVTDIIDNSSISLSALNPFLFKCYYYDHESKWYYCLSRYYVPLLMRWLSIDDSSYLTSESPAGYNLYVYCNNNPIMYEDPSGKGLLTALLIAIGIGIGTAVVGQLAVDLVTSAINSRWSFSSWEQYLGAAIGGGVGGLLLFSGIGGALSGAITSGLSTLIGNGLEMFTGDADEDYNLANLFVDTCASSVIGMLAGGITHISKINIGSHSFQQIFKSGLTKVARYSYSMSFKVLLKGFAAMYITGYGSRLYTIVYSETKLLGTF